MGRPAARSARPRHDQRRRRDQLPGKRPRGHGDRPGRPAVSRAGPARADSPPGIALQRLRGDRARHRRRPGRHRPHHHVEPLPRLPLQRLARRQAGPRPSRAHANLPRRHHERPRLLHERSRHRRLRDDDRPDQVRRDRHPAGRPHPPRPSVWRFDRQGRRRSCDKATTDSTPTSGCWPTPRPTRSRCSSWARTRAACGGAARTSGSAGRPGFTGAATTPRTCKCGSRPCRPWTAGRPTSCFTPPIATGPWLELFDRKNKTIDVDFGFLAFTTPPLSAAHSLDAKFTTTAMARELKTWAKFGPPLGRTWEPTDAERRRFPEIHPLVGNDWTMLRRRPARGRCQPSTAKPVDLARMTSGSEHEPERTRTRPAWHGTILPESDADIWLAAAFADYERIVADEKAIKAHAANGQAGHPRPRAAGAGPVRADLALPDGRRPPRRPGHRPVRDSRRPALRRVVRHRLRQRGARPGRAAGIMGERRSTSSWTSSAAPTPAAPSRRPPFSRPPKRPTANRSASSRTPG